MRIGNCNQKLTYSMYENSHNFFCQNNFERVLTLEALDPVVMVETLEAVDLFKLLLKLRLLLRAGVGGPGFE